MQLFNLPTNGTSMHAYSHHVSGKECEVRHRAVRPGRGAVETERRKVDAKSPRKTKVLYVTLLGTNN